MGDTMEAIFRKNERIAELTQENKRLREALRVIGIAAEMETGTLQKGGILKTVKEALKAE